MNVGNRPEIPERLRLGTERHTAWFELRRDLLALHGPPPPAGGPRAVLELRDAGVEVVAAVDARPEDHRTPGPVYSQSPQGALAVPTGRVFVRWIGGRPPPDWISQLEGLGYEPCEVAANAAVAPFAAWLRPIDRRITTGLARLERLAGVSWIASAEPELLRQSSRR